MEVIASMLVLGRRSGSFSALDANTVVKKTDPDPLIKSNSLLKNKTFHTVVTLMTLWMCGQNLKIWVRSGTTVMY